jgi:hypothetical protein
MTNEEDKPKNRAALRYNSLIRYTNRHTRNRHNQIAEERKHLQLLMEVLELQVLQNQTAIFLSRKNQQQSSEMII